MKFLSKLALCLLLLITSTASAVVTTTGDVTKDPWYPHVIPLIGIDTDGTLLVDSGSELENPCACVGYGSNATGEVTVSGIGSTWTLTNRWISSLDEIRQFYIGYEGNGILNIADGGSVQANGNACIGYRFGSNGVVSVEGTGSVWNCAKDLFVGQDGTGRLNVINNGQVNTTGSTVIGNASSEIHFDGGTLTTGGLIASTAQLTGTGTINTHGMIFDNIHKTIDSPDDLVETVILNSEPDQNITLNLDMNVPGVIGAGRTGTASLAITNSMEVNSTDAYFGYHAGSTGTGTVSGAGTTWNISNSLNVGHGGTGELSVTDGGTLSCRYCRIANEPGLNGTVTIAGPGSNWTCSSIFVGGDGNGVLNITNGAIVNKSPEVEFGGSSIGGAAGTSSIVNVSGAGTMWNNGGSLSVGSSGYGELNITDGGTVNCNDNYYNGFILGVQEGSRGKVAVSGTNSAWNISTNLFFGPYGRGEMYLTDGGTVNVDNTTWLSYSGSDKASLIHFEGGVFNTNSLITGNHQLTGTGTVNTQGIITDEVDLIFNAENGLQQTFFLTSDERNIKVNLNCDRPIYMGAGCAGRGTFAIQDGLTIHSDYGYLGYGQGSDGEATVSGAGSTWKIATPNSSASNLYVGYRGKGHLNILDGGAVSCKTKPTLPALKGLPARSTSITAPDYDRLLWRGRPVD